MGEIKDFFDIVKDLLTYYEIVSVYQQGLHFRNGDIIPRRRKKIPLGELNRIEFEEKELVDVIGKWKFFIPGSRPNLPSGYQRRFLNGFPLHKDRYTEILEPGTYFYLPLIDEIHQDSIQERILNLGNITVPTTDGEHSEIVSCNLRYRVVNLKKAYLAVHNYEKSLRDHTMSILAKYCRGKTSEQWKDPKTVDEVENNVEEDLKEATEKWGLLIHKVYITDNVLCKVIRLTHDGQPIGIQYIRDGTSPIEQMVANM